MVYKAFLYVGKIILYIIGCLLTIIICVFLFLFAAEWLWPELNGSYSLGNNIYMIEWDGGGRVIVQGTNIHGNTCYGGSPLIPSYVNQYDSLGNHAEYVIDAKVDGNWVIAMTNNKISNQRKFYILNKEYNPDIVDVDSIINTKIESFTDSNEFADKCFSKRITIKW